MSTLTKTEFAAAKGWRKQYVSELARKGRLVLTPDGKVDVEASNQRLEQTKRIDRQGVREHHARARGDAALEQVARLAELAAGDFALHGEPLRLAMLQLSEAQWDVVALPVELWEKLVEPVDTSAQ